MTGRKAWTTPKITHYGTHPFYRCKHRFFRAFVMLREMAAARKAAGR